MRTRIRFIQKYTNLCTHLFTYYTESVVDRQKWANHVAQENRRFPLQRLQVPVGIRRLRRCFMIGDQLRQRTRVRVILYTPVAFNPSSMSE